MIYFNEFYFLIPLSFGKLNIKLVFVSFVTVTVLQKRDPTNLNYIMMHYNTWCLPAIDYLSKRSDVASLENSAIETRRDECFTKHLKSVITTPSYCMKKQSKILFLQSEQYKVWSTIIYHIYGSVPSRLLFIVKLFTGDILCESDVVSNMWDRGKITSKILLQSTFS